MDLSHFSLTLIDGSLVPLMAIVHPVLGAPAGGSVRPSPAHDRCRSAEGVSRAAQPARVACAPLTRLSTLAASRERWADHYGRERASIINAMAINQIERDAINQFERQQLLALGMIALRSIVF